MRYDVAYLGKVRKIVDGEGKDLVSYRYDAKSGNVTRVRDRFGNDRDFDYDSDGRIARASRRAHGERTVEPVASFAYAKGREPVAVSLLNADGTPAVTTRLSRDRQGNVTSMDDGRGKAEVSYNKSGFPVSMRDPLGNVSKICYNTFNAPVSVMDANGIVTKYAYNDAGLVTRMERLDGSETLSSLSVAYDGAGRPVSYTDQDGLSKSFERDAFGKVLKEKFPDGSECAYSYDALGRRTSVIDENGHEIRFGWGRFGLKSRTTAAGQLTDYVRDDLGLVKEVVSKWNGSEDRHISSEYDEFGRLTYADYGNGEIERFEYDKWNRLAKHTRGKTEETYKYDHFGRLVEKRENGLATSYTYDAYGSRLSRVTKNRQGEVVSKENRAYDKFGRLAETAAGFGSKVTYAYDSKGRLARQIVDGSPIEYEYTKYGQLAGKYLGGKLNADASVTYEYSKSGQIVARTANGVRQTYEYDKKGQLLAVKDSDGNAVERYAYDKAGNMLKKTVNGKTTIFTFDDANQLVSSTTDGVTTRYAYDAAGRMVREGNKTYRYGYLDKVMSVSDGDTTRTFTYHADGQLASATVGGDLRAPRNTPQTETFLWDGLALIQRGDEQFINEPHVGGGNPVASSKGTSYFNDALGTTVGSKSNGKYSAAALTAFGEGSDADKAFFTGKPMVEGLGHAFWMRNYRAGLAKWQTADPMGYPDGWNQLAYCNNGVTSAVDLWGCETNVGGWWDLFESYAKNAAEIGGRDKIDELASQTAVLVDNQQVWALALCHVEARDCPDVWVRTGKKEVRNGVTFYEEKCTDRIYSYVAKVLMKKIDSPVKLTINVTGNASSVLGMTILNIPGAEPAGLVLTLVGGGAAVFTTTVDCSESVPYGLVFYRELLDDNKTVKPPRLKSHFRWEPGKSE